MQISSIGGTVPATIPASTGPASARAASSAAPANTAVSPAAPPAGAPAAPLPAASAANSAATASLIDPTYATSVGGKSYSGSISQSNGTYSISVPNVPGASVSGASLLTAEIALNAKIDELV